MTASFLASLYFCYLTERGEIDGRFSVQVSNIFDPAVWGCIEVNFFCLSDIYAPIGHS